MDDANGRCFTDWEAATGEGRGTYQNGLSLAVMCTSIPVWRAKSGRDRGRLSDTAAENAGFTQQPPDFATAPPLPAPARRPHRRRFHRRPALCAGIAADLAIPRVRRESPVDSKGADDRLRRSTNHGCVTTAPDSPGCIRYLTRCDQVLRRCWTAPARRIGTATGLLRPVGSNLLPDSATGRCRIRTTRWLAWLRGVSEAGLQLWSQPHRFAVEVSHRQGSRPVAPEIHPPSEMDGLTSRFDVKSRHGWVAGEATPAPDRVAGLRLALAGFATLAATPRMSSLRFDARILPELAEQLYDVA